MTLTDCVGEVVWELVQYTNLTIYKLSDTSKQLGKSPSSLLELFGMAARPAGGGGSSLNVKVVLLGEGCVGKTSIVLRYVENKFNDKHVQTLQV